MKVTGSGEGPMPPSLSDIEMARIWRAINTSASQTPLPRRRRFRVPWPAIALGGLCAMAAYLGARWLIQVRAASASGERSEATVFDRELRLPDGTRVALGPDTRLDQVTARAPDIRLVLVRGGAEVAVPAPESWTGVSNELPGTASRRLTVVAGPFEIHLYGGRARVTWHDGAPERRLEVQVMSGGAEILKPDDGRGPLQLGPGDTWTGRGLAAVDP